MLRAWWAGEPSKTSETSKHMKMVNLIIFLKLVSLVKGSFPIELPPIEQHPFEVGGRLDYYDIL